MNAQNLARLFGGVVQGPANHDVEGIVIDSRDVRPGFAFVALHGTAMDGHDFVEQAIESGATTVVVNADWIGAVPESVMCVRVVSTNDALKRACRVRLEELNVTSVGITGSVGKTTTKEMCLHLLRGSFPCAGTVGNLNTWTGISLSVLRITEPVDYFLTEMGMSGLGEIAELADMVRPRVGVVLNIGSAHIGLAGSQENIACAKAELLDALPADGLAICNGDDPLVRSVAGHSAAPIQWFGMECSDATVTITDIVTRPREIRATVIVAGERFAMALSAPGKHLLYDAAAAAAVALYAGVPIGHIVERLATFQPAAHRGELITLADGTTVVDDCYNSSPESLAAALNVLSHTDRRRRVAVIGDMNELGEFALAAHRSAGESIAGAATDLIAVGRFADDVANGAANAGMNRSRIVTVTDAAEAAELIIGFRGADTAILVKASRAVGLEKVVEVLQ